MMSERYFHFGKRQKNLAKTFFSHPAEITGSMNFGHIFRIMCSSDFSKTYKNLKESGIIKAVSKLTIFENLWISNLRRSLH